MAKTINAIIDIDSRKPGLAGELSNLKHRFGIFHGWPYCSLEGPIQALKIEDIEEQKRFYLLDGMEAKKAGQAYNNDRHTAFFRGQRMDRYSRELQNVFDKLYESVSRNQHFRRYLLMSGDAELVHTIGTKIPQQTIMTEDEFCTRLIRTRAKLRRQGEIKIGLASPDLWQMVKAAKMGAENGTSSVDTIADRFNEETAAIIAKADFELRRNSIKAFHERIKLYGTGAAIQMETYYAYLVLCQGSYPGPANAMEQTIDHVWRNYQNYFLE